MNTGQIIGLALVGYALYQQHRSGGGLGALFTPRQGSSNGQGSGVALPGTSASYAPVSYEPSAPYGTEPPGSSMTNTLVTTGIGSGVAIATALFGGGAASGAGAAGSAAAAGAGISASAALMATGIGAVGAILVWGITSRGWFRGGEESLHVNRPRDEFKQVFAHLNPYPNTLSDPNGPGFFGLAWLLHELAGSRGDAYMTAFNKADSRKEFEAAVRDIEALINSDLPRVSALSAHARANFTWNR